MKGNKHSMVEASKNEILVKIPQLDSDLPPLFAKYSSGSSEPQKRKNCDESPAKKKAKTVERRNEKEIYTVDDSEDDDVVAVRSKKQELFGDDSDSS